MAFVIDIDIGAGASNYDSNEDPTNTDIDLTNPSNKTGVLTSIEVYAYSTISNIKIGTFYGSAASCTNRDYELIASVTSGSKQTFTGKSCDVSTSDYLGFYAASGNIEMHGSSGSGFWKKSGDGFGTTTNYTDYSGSYPFKFGMYATGGSGVPDVPTSVSATDNLTDKVTITWTRGDGETLGHKVYRDGSVLNSDTAIAHGTNTFDDTTGTVGTTYAYTVKAINAAGLSAASTADNGIKIASGQAQILVTM